jgi:hypothetical protein
VGRQAKLRAGQGIKVGGEGQAAQEAAAVAVLVQESRAMAVQQPERTIEDAKQ